MIINDEWRIRQPCSTCTLKMLLALKTHSLVIYISANLLPSLHYKCTSTPSARVSNFHSPIDLLLYLVVIWENPHNYLGFTQNKWKICIGIQDPLALLFILLLLLKDIQSLCAPKKCGVGRLLASTRTYSL